jgi:phosphotransacetylase
MTDLTGKSWMAIGETDDPNAIIESFEAAAAVTKGDPVYLSADNKVSPATTAQDCIGIAVKSAAAAAMWSFANSMNSATASVQSFNEAASETPTRSRSIQRAGEDELYRRGVE